MNRITEVSKLMVGPECSKECPYINMVFGYTHCTLFGKILPEDARCSECLSLFDEKKGMEELIYE